MWCSFLRSGSFGRIFRLRQFGGRVNVIFERATGAAARESWRLLEFGDLDEAEKIVMAAARDGYRVRLLARPAFKSWPGLSERGLLLASKAEGTAAREARLLVGRSRNV